MADRGGGSYNKLSLNDPFQSPDGIDQFPDIMAYSCDAYHGGRKVAIQSKAAHTQCFRACLIDDLHQCGFYSGILQIAQHAYGPDDLAGFGTLFACQLLPDHIPDEFRTVIITGLCQ